MDKPSLAARRIRARRSPGAADKNVRECKCIVPSVFDLLLVQQHTMRLRCDFAVRGIDNVRRCCAFTTPAWVRGIEALVPHAIRNVLKWSDRTIVEIKNDEYLIGSMPAAHRENTILLDAHDVHPVFTQAAQRR